MTGALTLENIEQSFDEHHYCVRLRVKHGYSEHNEIESYEYSEYRADP